jgi:hypothetical protein
MASDGRIAGGALGGIENGGPSWPKGVQTLSGRVNACRVGRSPEPTGVYAVCE